MTVASFDGPFAYWVGFDQTGMSSKVSDAILSGHPELTTVARFELIKSLPRITGPSTLFVFELATATAVQSLLEKKAVVAEEGPAPTWELVWRQITQFGEPPGVLGSMFTVGMDPAPESSPDDLAQFNDYYTNVHVPELLAFRGYSRGTRYQLEHELRFPEPSCPEFCCIYEGDAERTARTEREIADPIANEPPKSHYSPGPPVWVNRHDGWGLVYRRLD